MEMGSAEGLRLVGAFVDLWTQGHLGIDPRIEALALDMTKYFTSSWEMEGRMRTVNMARRYFYDQSWLWDIVSLKQTCLYGGVEWCHFMGLFE